MGEVTKHNFEAMLPKIKRAIEECDFVALDIEFSGLFSTDQCKPSYFDTPPGLYQKLRNRASKFAALQVGLATFASSKDESLEYKVHAYNFYIFPTSLGSMGSVFCCQASSLDFLSKHNFDFNKCIGDGIGYLNECQEKIVKGELERNICLYGLESLTDQKMTQALCSEVAAWLATAQNDDVFIHEKSAEESIYPNYVLHELLKQRFPNVWPVPSSEEIVKVKKISDNSRSLIEAEMAVAGIGVKDHIVAKAVGFSQVIRLIASSKKPVVGHNMLSDLTFIHEKFYKALPGNYGAFKASMVDFFPVVFDTKHIASVLRQHNVLREFVPTTALGDLHASLTTRRAMSFSLFSPVIVLASGCEGYGSQKHIHEAGYDAFICGTIFLRLTHLWSSKDVPSLQAEPISFTGYIRMMQPFANQVNAIRCSVTHVNLSGSDPPSHLPRMLYVRQRDTRQPPITAQQLATLLSAYGHVDVKKESTYTALVAVSNQYCEKDILRGLYKDPRLYVAPYSFWKHSVWIQRCILVGVLLAGATCGWAILHKAESPGLREAAAAAAS